MRRWAVMAVMTVVLAMTAAAVEAAPNWPFPQHTRYVAGSVAPNHKTQAQLDTAVRKFYDVWKRNFLRAGCGTGRWYGYIGPQPSIDEGVPISVSEAQGYAMLIVAIMGGHDADAQKIFDGL